jgi:MYXO-CTERM domain-containing protein
MTEMGVTGLFAAEQQRVASDAFATFTAEARGVDAAAAFSSITIDVVDGAGNAVEGSAELLSEHVPTPGVSHLLIGWSPNVEPELAETLALRASAASNERSFEVLSTLTVSDVDPVLELPEFDAVAWAEVTGDRGSPQSCPSSGSCGNTFGDETYLGRSVTISAEPVTDVTVAWEYRIEALLGKGVFVSPPAKLAAIAGESTTVSLEFSEVIDEYCVRITGRDLRTGDEQSREWCATPEPPIETSNQDAIQGCPSPPAGFERRFCLAKLATGAIPPDTCDPFLDPPIGSGGEGGVPGVSGAGGSPGAPNDDVDPSAGESARDDSDTTVRTYGGCGCRTTAGESAPGAALLVLFGACVAARRVRRRDRLRRERPSV